MAEPHTPAGAPSMPAAIPRFLIGHWLFCSRERTLQQHDVTRRLDPRHADVLLMLATRAGEVVTTDELLAHCWPGGIYGDGPLHKAMALLRRALGDDARCPAYIQTVRKRGYRLVAPVQRLAPQAQAADLLHGAISDLQSGRTADALGKVEAARHLLLRAAGPA